MMIDDLILFFAKDQASIAASAVVVPHDMYSKSTIDVKYLPAGWQDAVLSEHDSAAGRGKYYVLNLAKLLPPAGKNQDVQVTLANPFAQLVANMPSAATSAPSAGDLVVVPWDDPGKPFLVPRATYELSAGLAHDDVPDLFYMVEKEGVLVANVPKLDVDGISCFLLATVNLRSGALLVPGQ
jgi:hypothetical protein